MNIPEQLIFVTGNEGKLREAREILAGFSILNSRLDVPELQGDHRSIAKAKAESAFEQVKKPVFVEDTCLIFDEFGELPGPYIKDFVRHIGVGRMPLLLEGFSSNKAKAICTIAYKDTSEAMLFEGVCEGKIVSAKGESGFAWDPIFMPEGHDKTFAEMRSDEKNAISHRRKAFEKFRKYLES
jgi:inosine triphosphate pyrophosphatase